VKKITLERANTSSLAGWQQMMMMVQRHSRKLVHGGKVMSTYFKGTIGAGEFYKKSQSSN
jgi:hypothetical protein